MFVTLVRSGNPPRLAAGRTTVNSPSEGGANSERDEPADRIGGVVVVTPRATHEAALVAIEEWRVFIGEVADVQRQVQVLDRLVDLELVGQVQVEGVGRVHLVAAPVGIAIGVAGERSKGASAPVPV